MEEEFLELTFAHNSSEFLLANERDEHHEDQQRQSQDSLPRTPAEFGVTLPKRLVAIETNRSILKNLETGKHKRKES